MQVNPAPWADTQQQYAADPEADRVDLDYFRALIAAIAPNREALDSRLARLCEIPPPELDPIEHAVLWLGLYELESCPELPYRVALAEAVQLTKQFRHHAVACGIELGHGVVLVRTNGCSGTDGLSV